MEKQILEIIRDTLFMPLIHLVRKEFPFASERSMTNAAGDTALAAALKTGRVQYVNGVFSGQFSAATSAAIKAMGGRFDERTRTYRISQHDVPSWAKAEAAVFQTKARTIHQFLKTKLNEIQIGLDQKLKDKRVNAQRTIDSLEDGFKGAAKKLELSPTLAEGSREKLAQDYTENMDLFIKKFAKREIVGLREAVEENANQGYRFDELIPDIKKRYGITARHAKFLARNETSIFMSKFHEQRYKEAGITRYIWSTSHDARVRPALGTTDYGDNHRRLEGRVFSYDDPPVVDTANGRKANPGEDYNCRCVAIPILATTRAGAQREAKEYRELVPEPDYGLVTT